MRKRIPGVYEAVKFRENKAMYTVSRIRTDLSFRLSLGTSMSAFSTLLQSLLAGSFGSTDVVTRLGIAWKKL
jgi:hypothetical protein